MEFAGNFSKIDLAVLRVASNAMSYVQELSSYLSIPAELQALLEDILQSMLRTFFSLQWLLTSLETISSITLSLVKIVASLVVFIFLILLIARIFRKEGIVVLPFETFADDKGNKYSGKAISDLLKAELQRILWVHSLEFKEISIEAENLVIPKLVPTSETFEFSISDIGTLGAGPASLSLGRLIIMLKRLCPGTDPVSVITGSVERFGSVIKLTACLEGRNTRVWNVGRKIKGDKSKLEEHIPNLVRDLSFVIAHDLAKEYPRQNVSAKTCTGIKFFTEALEAYYLYTLTGEPKDLERSRRNCINAIYSENGYEKAINMLNNLGVIYSNKNNYKQAEKIFNHIDKLKPGLSNFGKGLVYLNQNQRDKALDAFSAALEVDPKLAVAWTNKAALLFYLEKYQEALDASEEALKINLNIVEAHITKSGALFHLGRYEEALDASENALKINPKIAEAYINKSGALINLGRYREALDVSLAALKVNPSLAVAWNNAGGALYKMGRYDAALKALDAALKIDPKLAIALVSKGATLIELKRYQEALNLSEEALKINPDLPEARKNKEFAENFLRMNGKTLLLGEKIYAIRRAFRK